MSARAARSSSRGCMPCMPSRASVASIAGSMRSIALCRRTAIGRSSGSAGAATPGGGAVSIGGEAIGAVKPNCAAGANEGGGPSNGIGGRRRVQPQRCMRLRSVPDEMPCSAQMSATGRSVYS